MRRARVVLGLGLIVMALLFAGCSKSSSPGSPQTATDPAAGGASAQQGPQGRGQFGGAPGAQRAAGRSVTIPVQAANVHVGPLVTDNNTAGTVVPVTQSQVAAQVAGVVARLVHRVGDWVQTGDTVVQLDDSQLKITAQNAQSALDNAQINLQIGQDNADAAGPRLTSQLQSAQDSLNAAQKNYDSQKALFDLGGVSGSQLDNAQSQLATAQANLQAANAALDQNAKSDSQNLAQLKLAVQQAANQLALAQLNLQNASIRAPFAGQIAAVNVSPGMYVSQNTAIFLLVSGERQINFTEPPTDAFNFKIGDEVRFTYNGKVYPVRVLQMPSAPINGIVPMVASSPAGLNLPFGSVGTVTYTMAVATGAIVPIASIQTKGNQNYVYAISNATVAQQTIGVIAESGTSAVVSGLKDGDVVVVNPPPGLLIGASVQPFLSDNGTQTGAAQTASRPAGAPGGGGQSAAGQRQGGAQTGSAQSSGAAAAGVPRQGQSGATGGQGQFGGAGAQRQGQSGFSGQSQGQGQSGGATQRQNGQGQYAGRPGTQQTQGSGQTPASTQGGTQ